MTNDKSMPYNYLKGRTFTNNLKQILGFDNVVDLSPIMNVPNSTFITWHNFDRTGYELIIRTHIVTGVSVQAIALGILTEEDKEKVRNLGKLNTMPVPNYIKGKEYIDLLKKFSGKTNYAGLSNYFNVPQSVFQTVALHDRALHELTVRLVLDGIADINEFYTETDGTRDFASIKQSYADQQ